MARATTKADLTASANGQFDKMWKLIDSMSEEQQKAAFAEEMATAGKETHWSRDKNLRDVLVHLYEWHQLLLNWVKANSNDERKPFLPEPYNWKTYPAMNVGFWKKHQNTPLEEARLDRDFPTRSLLRFDSCQSLRLGDEENKIAYQNI